MSKKTKKCRICGKGEMLTAEGTCVYCGYSPSYPLSKEWKKLQRKLLPKQQAKDRDFARRIRAFGKTLKPKKHIEI